MMRTTQRGVGACLIALVFLLAACGAAPTATPVPPTPTPLPTATPEPTDWQKLVSIGDYALYMECHGHGSPVVVIEPGLHNQALAWRPTMEGIMGTTTVCAYTRANNPGSDKAPKPRSSGQMTEDLHKLVAAAGLKPPYVLVGHSMGGFQTILYTSRWPSEVAGLVLVDSSHPDQEKGALAVLPPVAEGEDGQLTKFRKSLVWWQDPTEVEGWDLPASSAEVRAVASLGSVPLVVISSSADGQAKDILRYYYIRDAAWIPAYAQAHIDLQRQFLKLSTNSAFVIAEKAGHGIHFDDPVFLAQTIVKLVEQVRQK